MATFNLLPDLGEIWYTVSARTALVRLLEVAQERPSFSFLRK